MDEIVQFLYLNICYVLCSIVNNIVAHVIWKYFSFNFIPILKNIPTFPEFGFYNDDWEMNFKKSS